MSLHHGVSNGATSVSISLCALTGGICRYLPSGQSAFSEPVTGSMKVLGSLVSGWNQCVMSYPALSMSGSHNGL